MSLSFYYEFGAPADMFAAQLEEILRDVEREAQRLGLRTDGESAEDVSISWIELHDFAASK